MSLNINGNSPTEVVFNNQQCLKVVYNGVTVWEKGPGLLLSHDDTTTYEIEDGTKYSG